MNKNALILCAVCALLAAWLLPGCSDVQDLKAPVYKTNIAEEETSTVPFEKEFPLEYKSYLKNNEDTVMTVYKGSVPYHKNDNVNPLPTGYKFAQPYLKNLWLGYPPSATSTTRPGATPRPWRTSSRSTG